MSHNDCTGQEKDPADAAEGKYCSPALAGRITCRFTGRQVDAIPVPVLVVHVPRRGANLCPSQVH